ncbi:MAG: hypothetical protein AB7F86_18165 [Bdellovibrionales bacterium]
MIRLRIISIALLVLATACAPKKKRSSVAANPEKKNENPSQDYVGTIEFMGLIQTGQGPREVYPSNRISIKGVGEKSTYTARYRFNSKEHRAFHLLTYSQRSIYSNCTIPEAKAKLFGPGVKGEVSTLDHVEILPQSDYVFELSLTPGCQEFDITFDVLAWIGSRDKDPKLAVICERRSGEQITFVLNVNIVTGFSSRVGQEKYLTMDTYCGEHFSGTKMTCEGNLDLDGSPLRFTDAGCEAENARGEKRRFQVTFDSATDQMAVTCNKNGFDTIHESFQHCRTRVIDYRPYSEILTK